MTTSSIIHPNVRFGANHRIDDFVIIGAPPRETSPGEMATLIGPNATFRSHTIIYAGNHIGANFKTGHSVMFRESNEMGGDSIMATPSNMNHHVKSDTGVASHQP